VQLPDNTPIRVLYIAGFGRSGSTLLGAMLGKLPGTAYLGELERIWLKGVIQNDHCGCRREFHDCDFWRQTFGQAFGGMSSQDGQEMLGLFRSDLRTRHLPGMLLDGRSRKRSAGRQRLEDRLLSLYRSIRETMQARLIVDSSKSPIYGRLLNNMPGIALKAVHLVRDPRAVVHSWQRRKLDPLTAAERMRLRPAKAVEMWLGWNLAAEAMTRGRPRPEAYLRLRYEDFLEDPQAALRRVLSFAGMETEQVPLLGPREVELGENHILAGSFLRFDRGRVRLEADEEWRTAMPFHTKLFVSLLTGLMLGRYGYPAYG